MKWNIKAALEKKNEKQNEEEKGEKKLKRTETNLFEGVVNTLDAVFLHIQQETRRQLRSGCAGVEQRGRRVCEKPLRHQIVRLHGSSNIPLVDAHRYAHEHMLNALHNQAVHSIIEKNTKMKRRRTEVGTKQQNVHAPLLTSRSQFLRTAPFHGDLAIRKSDHPHPSHHVYVAVQ